MKKNTLISIIIGSVVILGAFLAVFGSSLKNLIPEEAAENMVNNQIPAVSTTVTSTTKPVFNNADDRDDNEYDEDDYVGITPTSAPAPKSTTTPTPTPSGYTLTQVAVHNSATSCWSAINGNVYDLTNWVNSHPGGRATILMICGKDGSPLFNNQHGRSSRVANILAGYEIGALN